MIARGLFLVDLGLAVLRSETTRRRVSPAVRFESHRYFPSIVMNASSLCFPCSSGNSHSHRCFLLACDIDVFALFPHLSWNGQTSSRITSPSSSTSSSSFSFAHAHIEYEHQLSHSLAEESQRGWKQLGYRAGREHLHRLESFTRENPFCPKWSRCQSSFTHAMFVSSSLLLLEEVMTFKLFFVFEARFFHLTCALERKR